MKALTYNRYGRPEVVQISEVPRPEPQPDEILVRVHASAVNTSDWRIRAAAFPGVTALPARLIFGVLRPRNKRLGSEFAGVVEAVGLQVTKFAVGQPVFGMTPKGGATAEYITIAEDAAVAEFPDILSFNEAAALPFGGLAALVFLEQFANVSVGQHVLIVGASGGVGSYSVQIAKAAGAHVTGVSGRESQSFVKDLGADQMINYRATDLATINDRYDIVLDTVGAISPRLSRHLLRQRGLFLPLNIGLRELGAALLNPFRDQRIRLGVNNNSARDLKRLAELVSAGSIIPVIDSVFGMNRVVEAHELVELRHRKGAVIVEVVDARPT